MIHIFLFCLGFWLRQYTVIMAPLHEGAHALMVILTGGNLTGVSLEYVTFTGGWDFLIFPAGLIAEVVFYNTLSRFKWTRWLGIGAHVSLIFACLMQIGNPGPDLKYFRSLWFLLFYCLVMASHLKGISRRIRDKEASELRTSTTPIK